MSQGGEKIPKQVRINSKKLFVAMLNLCNRRGWVKPKQTEPFTVENWREKAKHITIVVPPEVEIEFTKRLRAFDQEQAQLFNGLRGKMIKGEPD